MIRFYRGFLSWMLDRDYTVKRAVLRNTFALGAFSTGFLLIIAGAALSGLVGGAAAVVSIPGVVLLVVGLIGIVVHALESLYLGGRKSVLGGLFLGGGMLLLLAADLHRSSRDGGHHVHRDDALPA
jgi:multidrug efflux pump